MEVCAQNQINKIKCCKANSFYVIVDFTIITNPKQKVVQSMSNIGMNENTHKLYRSTVLGIYFKSMLNCWHWSEETRW